jgi:hypothetical protein
MPKIKNENYIGKTEKIITYVEKDLDTRIRQVAEENGMYISEVVRQSIVAGLEKFFVESQGSFLQDKIQNAMEDAVAKQMEVLQKNLEKRLIGFLALNTNHVLQSQSMIKNIIRLLVSFNNENIKSLSEEKSINAFKQFIEVFEKESLGYMKTVYEKNKKIKELELAE